MNHISATMTVPTSTIDAWVLALFKWSGCTTCSEKIVASYPWRLHWSASVLWSVRLRSEFSSFELQKIRLSYCCMLCLNLAPDDLAAVPHFRANLMDLDDLTIKPERKWSKMWWRWPQTWHPLFCGIEIKYEIGLNNCCITLPSRLYPFVCNHPTTGKLENAAKCALLHSEGIDSSIASVDPGLCLVEVAWSNLISLGYCCRRTTSHGSLSHPLWQDDRLKMIQAPFILVQ